LKQNDREPNMEHFMYVFVRNKIGVFEIFHVNLSASTLDSLQYTTRTEAIFSFASDKFVIVPLNFARIHNIVTVETVTSQHVLLRFHKNSLIYP
jgi:hypothetical protein